MDMKNNLFSYATSELSQDAFICWLCSFALDGAKEDPTLRECAKEMIRLFLPEINNQSFILTKIERQRYHTDVLLTVQTSNCNYKIIVEDKTYTKEHNDQLETYLAVVGRNHSDHIVRGVYYKTGFQCDLSAVEKAGYTIITRTQTLSLMKKFVSKTKNQIFLDYFEYWNNFQQETEQYLDSPISEWDWKQINGFYDHLKTSNFFKERNLWMGYGYVANRSGGFHGLWAGIDNHRICINGNNYELYLQLETSAEDTTTALLCLKLSVVDPNPEKSVVREARDQLIYSEDWTYKLGKYNFRKPSRLSLGQHMTIGTYSANPSNYVTLLEALDLAIRDYTLLMKDFF